MYIDLAGFITKLTANISDTDPHLPIPHADYQQLLNVLADGDYSFLEIRDGKVSEYVKVTNVCDRLVLTRGAEETKPLAFRCGTGVKFVMTMQGIKDTICQMEN